MPALRNELSSDLVSGTPPYGKAFEHFVMVETRRILDYCETEVKSSFFRTTDGAEVDLILEFEKEIWAIEIKASSMPQMSQVRGLKAFIKDHTHTKALCVCLTPRPYISDNIEFLPWRDFMAMLGNKK